MISLRLYREQIEFPAPNPPEWKDRVERWYQMDAPSYALAESYFRRSSREKIVNPECLILASPTASNESDFVFVENGASSAHRFAHTLPNVRFSGIGQLMKWEGPVVCLQNGAKTIVSALSEGVSLLQNGPNWVLSVLSHGKTQEVFYFEIINGPGDFSVSMGDSCDASFSDQEALAWFDLALKKGVNSTLKLPHGVGITRA